MNKFWIILGLAGFSLVVGPLFLAGTILLIAACAVVNSKVAEAGLSRSIERAKAELLDQPDPAKARALDAFVAKMEAHKGVIFSASFGLTLSTLFIVGQPVILLVWLLWMASWRMYAYVRLCRAQA